MTGEFRKRARRLALCVSTLLAGTIAGSAGAAGPGVWKWPLYTGFSVATPVAEINDPDSADGCPIESPDGLSLVIASRRGPGGDNDLWSADRLRVTDPFGPPAMLPAPVNSDFDDFCPTPTAGRTLFFVSARPAACGGANIYTSRQGLTGVWSEPEVLDCAPDGPNFNDAIFSPSLVKSPQGTFLFYSSPGERADHDIYVSRRSAQGKFGPGRRVGALSNLIDDDRMPNVRPLADGGYEIVFSSNRPTWGRHDEPAYGDQDVYRSVSHKLPFRWTRPVNLGPSVNGPSGETRATLSADGRRLYFGRDGEIYMSER